MVHRTSARSRTAFQSDHGRCFGVIVDDGGWRAGEFLTGKGWLLFVVPVDANERSHHASYTRGITSAPAGWVELQRVRPRPQDFQGRARQVSVAGQRGQRGLSSGRRPERQGLGSPAVPASGDQIQPPAGAQLRRCPPGTQAPGRDVDAAVRGVRCRQLAGPQAHQLLREVAGSPRPNSTRCARHTSRTKSYSLSELATPSQWSTTPPARSLEPRSSRLCSGCRTTPSPARRQARLAPHLRADGVLRLRSARGRPRREHRARRLQLHARTHASLSQRPLGMVAGQAHRLGSTHRREHGRGGDLAGGSPPARRARVPRLPRPSGGGAQVRRASTAGRLHPGYGDPRADPAQRHYCRPNGRASGLFLRQPNDRPTPSRARRAKRARRSRIFSRERTPAQTATACGSNCRTPKDRPAPCRRAGRLGDVTNQRPATQPRFDQQPAGASTPIRSMSGRRPYQASMAASWCWHNQPSFRLPAPNGGIRALPTKSRCAAGTKV